MYPPAACERPVSRQHPSLAAKIRPRRPRDVRIIFAEMKAELELLPERNHRAMQSSAADHVAQPSNRRRRSCDTGQATSRARPEEACELHQVDSKQGTTQRGR